MAIAYAIDLGGTTIKLGLVDEQSNLLANTRIPTNRDMSAQTAMAQTVEQLRQLAQQQGVEPEAIGVCCAGLVDVEAGVVRSANNLPQFTNAPLRELLEQALNLPALLENDANAAAFGEFCQLRQREPDLHSLTMMVLGTGVGGGVVLNGEVWRGGGLAGEIGHCIVHPGGRACSCGQRGCLETYASASAIASQADERMPMKNGGRWDCEQVFAEAAMGNKTACAIIDEAAQAVALIGLNLSRLLDLQAIVLGGGVSEAGEPFCQRIVQWLERLNWSLQPVSLKVRLAQCGNQAGLLGAGAQALQTAAPEASMS